MKEDYCSFELSRVAKEAGFDWPTFYWYTKNGELHIDPDKNHNKEFFAFSAPTHCHLAKWLREKHRIIVFVDWKYALSPFYHIITPDNELIGNVGENHHDVFEAGLKKALKLI